MFPPVRQSISTWSSENTRSEHSVWSLRSSSLETCLPPSLQNDLIKKIVFLRFSAANRKTLILLEDRFVCCWNFSATYSGNHAMFCDNSTSHLNKIKMSPEILNKCSIEFCRPSSLSSVCSQNNAGPNIDFMIKIYMIRMCIYIYIHIRNHCSLLYETFSLKKMKWAVTAHRKDADHPRFLCICFWKCFVHGVPTWKQEPTILLEIFEIYQPYDMHL